VTARYFFNVMDGAELPDFSGIDFATDEEAIAHAWEIAINIAEVSPAHDGPQRFVSVVREDGYEVAKVPVYREQVPLMAELLIAPPVLGHASGAQLRF